MLKIKEEVIDLEFELFFKFLFRVLDELGYHLTDLWPYSLEKHVLPFLSNLLIVMLRPVLKVALQFTQKRGIISCLSLLLFQILLKGIAEFRADLLASIVGHLNFFVR